jgi:putative phosphoesterase
MANAAIIGLISDTHGLMRQEALTALKGTDLIIHAGDVGKPGITEQLRAVAPVVAVRGNVDQGAWASQLPITVTRLDLRRSPWSVEFIDLSEEET